MDRVSGIYSTPRTPWGVFFNTISPSSANFTEIGQVILLRATVFDQNNNTITGASIAWSSSNTEVASVSTQGRVTALKNGTSQITARSGNSTASAVATVTAPVPNRSPQTVGTIDAQELTEGGSPVEVDVSGAFRDPDGDDLSYTAESSDDQVATASVSGATVTIRPVSAGTATVTVTAKDPGGLTATQNIAVIVAVEGRIPAGNRIPGFPTGFWVPDQLHRASFSIVSGQVRIEFDDGGYIVEAGVTYTCDDGAGCRIEGDLVTLGVIVVGEAPENEPPEAVGTIAAQELTEGGAPVEVDVSGAFRDPDGDDLSYTAESSDDQVATASVSGATVTIRPVSAGTATVTVTAKDPGGLTATQNIAVIVAVEGRIPAGNRIPGFPTGFWVPDQLHRASFSIVSGQVRIEFDDGGYIVEAGVTYTCDDGAGCRIEGDLVTLGVIVVGDAPENQPPETVGTIAAQELTEGGAPAEVDVSGAFRDPDGDDLSYTAESSDDQVATASVSGAAVTIRPVSEGSATVTVTAKDPGGLTAMQTIDVTVIGSQLDRVALVALYNATNGPNWTNNTNWLSNAPLSEWHGIGTDGDGRVVSIEFEQNNLQGSIPPELGQLTNLTTLNLAKNVLLRVRSHPNWAS